MFGKSLEKPSAFPYIARGGRRPQVFIDIRGIVPPGPPDNSSWGPDGPHGFYLRSLKIPSSHAAELRKVQSFILLQPKYYRRPTISQGSAVFGFLLTLRPPGSRCFPGELFSLFRAKRSHAFSSAFASGGLTALSAHFAHDFGNKVPSHSSIL